MKFSKKFVGLVGCCLLGASVLAGAVEVDEPVVKIKEALVTLDKGKGLSQVEFSVNPDEPGGVHVTRFTNGKKELVKLVVKSTGPHGKDSFSYYFEGGEIVAIFESSAYWTYIRGVDENGEKKTKGVALEREMYFSGEKCLLHTLREANSPEKDGAKALLDDAETKKVSDAEREEYYLNKGRDFSKISSQAELEAHLKG